MTAVKLPTVVLDPPETLPEYSVYAKHIVQCMTGNNYFTNPSPVLTVVSANIAALDAAIIAAKTRAPGLVAERNLKYAVVVSNVHALRSYVQVTVDANVAEAEAIATSAGMGLKRIGSRKKLVLEATMGGPGLVVLRAKAVGKRVAYEWQYSLDGGKTWLSLAITTDADTSMSGLTAGTTCLFRFRTTIRKVTGDWSQTVSFFVH